MTNENDLIQKLIVSKKIMEKHDTIGRGGQRNIETSNTIEKPQLTEFTAPNSTYNIPEEYSVSQVSNVKTQQPLTQDRIMSSRLPDEIKKLMIEHPINQPSITSQSEISDELVNKATRLMNVNAKGETINETKAKTKPQTNTQSNTTFNGDIKEMIREAVREVLSENGLLVESTTKSNETFSFKVGKHVFEGKVTKIKKIS